VLARFQRARLVVVNGAGFEKWVAGVSLPSSRLVDTAAGFASEFLTNTGPSHRHGAAGEHSHAGIDGHTWMDPLLAIRQCQAIGQALERCLPSHRDRFAANLVALTADLRALDRRFAALAPRLSECLILCSHGAYDYLVKRHGIPVTNLDLDPETPLNVADLAALRERFGADARRRLLWWKHRRAPPSPNRWRRNSACGTWCSRHWKASMRTSATPALTICSS
jgi:zinc transport system substrate-binding protein